MKKDYSSYSNAVYRDEELRAVKAPKIWKELKRSQTLGLESWNILAKLTKKTLISRAKSVEKIQIFDQSLDTVGRILFSTPNINKSNKIEKWEDLDLDIEETEEEEELISKSIDENEEEGKLETKEVEITNE